MLNKNLDGIKKNKTAKPQSPTVKIEYTFAAEVGVRRPTGRDFLKQKFVLPVIIFIIIVGAFAGGMNFALRTPKSIADQNTISASATPPGLAGNLMSVPSTTVANNLSSADLYNTPLQVLQTYFQNTATDQTLADRKIKLKQFLIDHDSPLVDVSDTIAEQPHWQLILAISFAESTLGKKCYEFNCSGIGGATNIRSYKSFANWILDFNRLLDKRYNNWTLDEMCGVYVQPCTHSWLNATGQILDQLKQENIN